jgi:hypothetical protein
MSSICTIKIVILVRVKKEDNSSFLDYIYFFYLVRWINIVSTTHSVCTQFL